MAHLALHFPVVKRKTDSNCRLAFRELKELPERFVFTAILILLKNTARRRFYPMPDACGFLCFFDEKVMKPRLSVIGRQFKSFPHNPANAATKLPVKPVSKKAVQNPAFLKLRLPDKLVQHVNFAFQNMRF
jgi:hypothetical protein